MQWLRLYTEVLDDPKVQRLPAHLFKTWINLLCLARKNDGRLPADIQDIAFALRLDPESTRDQLQELENAGLFEPSRQGSTPHNWNKRQFKSDHDGNDRVRRYRDKRRNVTRNVTGNGDVTPPEQSRTDTDTEQKDTPPTPPERGGKRDKAPKQEYPPDFEAFWREYPRKKRKDAALKAWNAARKRAPPEQITAGAARYAAESEGKDPQYIAHASTWLRAGGWKDEPDHEHRRTINADRIAEIVNGRDPDADNPPREHLWPALERPRDTGTG